MITCASGSLHMSDGSNGYISINGGCQVFSLKCVDGTNVALDCEDEDAVVEQLEQGMCAKYCESCENIQKNCV